MAVLTRTKLKQIGKGGFMAWARKAVAVTADYVAFEIPPEAVGEVLVNVEVNSAGTYKAEYSISDDDDLDAGTQRVKDVFGSNQSTDRDFSLPAGTRLVVVTHVSGSFDVEVSIK